MATETTNYHFIKPAETDYYDVNVQNNNWDAADQELKDLNDKKVTANGGDISETKVSTFVSNASQWPIPAAGEPPKTLWGKTKKFIEDFKSWMTGVCLLGQLVSNNTTNNSGLPASAAAVYQEAQLRAQQIAQLNSDKASKNSNNIIGSVNTYTKGVGLNNASYREAPVCIRARSSESSWARPGIGLEREGVEGAFLYYEDQKMWFIDHNGTKHKITSS